MIAALNTGACTPMPNQYTRTDPAMRFWSKVDKSGPIPDFAPHLGNCWLWTACRQSDGYARFRVNDKKTVQAHRWAWERERGRILEGLHMDHLCRVRSCVNPAHLEPVTCRENILRGFGFPAVQHRARLAQAGPETTKEGR